MNIVCLDLEGVLAPEFWIEIAKATGIPELTRTTRDEPDYDKLMQFRMDILKAHGLKLADLQKIIADVPPAEGAKAFLDELRSLTQVIIVSDTFDQFAKPMMQKLGWPTIFCNTLNVNAEGEIVGYTMRAGRSKRATVLALQNIGYDTIASGDSFNDLSMIEISKAGFFFRTTDHLKQTYPNVPAYETFDELLAAIKAAL